MRDLTLKLSLAVRGLVLFPFCASALIGQEAIRSSLAGEAAAEARRYARETAGYYNLNLGPTFWRFEAGLGLEHNSNVRYQSDATEDDLIVRPDLDVAIRWPVTELNTLVLDAGFGYAKYLNHSDLDRLYVRPGTQLSFDLYTGDVRINFHDRLEIRQETYQNPLVSGTGDFQRLENTVGVTADWDLNELIVSGGFDHEDYVNLGDDFWPDGRTESLFGSAGWLVSSTVTAGFEAGGSLISYNDAGYSDGEQFSAGGFFDGKVTQYITARAGLGVTGTYFDENRYDPYGYVSLRHRVNATLGYSLSGGREVRSGLQWARTAQVVDVYHAAWEPSWDVFRDWTVGTPLFYQHVSESGGIDDETVDQYGIGVRVSRLITERMTAALEYRFVYRESDLPDRDYSLNRVLLRMGYRF